MQLDMAKQQREMMITSQAAQMTADAQQHKMQIEMQTKMVPSISCLISFSELLHGGRLHDRAVSCKSNLPTVHKSRKSSAALPSAKQPCVKPFLCHHRCDPLQCSMLGQPLQHGHGHGGGREAGCGEAGGPEAEGQGLSGSR